MLPPVDPESRVPAGRPIRAVRALADAALAELSPVFDAIYAEGGRPSVPPERLPKASLLMALHSIRGELRDAAVRLRRERHAIRACIRQAGCTL
jgi:transposase